MPRSKNRKRGQGRPKSVATELDYSIKSTPEKRSYHNKARDRSEQRPTRSETHCSTETVQDMQTPPTKSAGRPPLGNGPMTPRTLQRRSTARRSRKRRTLRTSKVRSNASMQRWNRTNEDVEHDADDNDSICQSIQPHPVDEPVDNIEQDSNLFEKTSRATIFRRKVRLVGKLPSNLIQHLDIFIATLHKLDRPDLIPPCRYEYNSSLSKYQRLYRAKCIADNVFGSCDESARDELMKYWLDIVMSHEVLEKLLRKLDFNIPDYLQPRVITVTKIAEQLRGTFLARQRTNQEQRVNGIKFVAATAKSAALSSKVLGDISALSHATECSRKFASKVLLAIESNTEETLYHQNLRNDSIKFTPWMDKIKEFVLSSDNSRPVPGKETISIRYGVRVEKYLLQKSRYEIAREFKALNPDCPFQPSVLMREFPQNAVTPTNRDNERNTCPTHANVRRLVKALHKIGVANEIPISCRAMVWCIMCQDTPGINMYDPVSYKRECAYSECENCPSVKIMIPKFYTHNNKKKLVPATVTYSQWDKTWSDDKKKKVFGLVKHVVPVVEAVDKLIDMLPELKRHIYASHVQWHAHSTMRANLDDTSVITIEDYQQNMEIVYEEMPTSTSYSGNKMTVAMFPMIFEFLNDDGELNKIAYIFLTDDKQHDHQQVRAFEKEAFRLFREETGKTIESWARFTDGCGAQFRSQFCNADLMSACHDLQLKHASFHYFEAHEGKNISDAVGSIGKCAYMRAVSKRKVEGVTSAKEVVDIVNKNLKEKMPKFKILKSVHFPKLKRIPAKERVGMEFDGIMCTHSITVRKDGLIADQLSCFQCTASKICEECMAKDLVITNPGAETDESEDEIIYDSDDEGATDDEESDCEENLDDETPFNRGDIVWAKCGKRFYPAKIVGKDEVPAQYHKALFSVASANHAVVSWYGENRFSRVHVSKIDILAESREDNARAASLDILPLYNLAVRELRND